MITHCRFCEVELSSGGNCKNCDYNYLTLNDGDGWECKIGPYYIDVYSKHSDIYDRETFHLIVSVLEQILPDTPLKDLELYLTFV